MCALGAHAGRVRRHNRARGANAYLWQNPGSERLRRLSFGVRCAKFCSGGATACSKAPRQQAFRRDDAQPGRCQARVLCFGCRRRATNQPRASDSFVASPRGSGCCGRRKCRRGAYGGGSRQRDQHPRAQRRGRWLERAGRHVAKHPSATLAFAGGF